MPQRLQLLNTLNTALHMVQYPRPNCSPISVRLQIVRLIKTAFDRLVVINSQYHACTVRDHASAARPEGAMHWREEQRHKQARCEAAADPGLEGQPRGGRNGLDLHCSWPTMPSTPNPRLRQQAVRRSQELAGQEPRHQEPNSLAP